MSDEIAEIRKDILTKPAVITLDITVEKLNDLTWEQYEVIEAGAKASYRDLREIVSLFVSGMDQPAAKAMLGRLKTKEIGQVLEQFITKVVEMKSVNPTTGGD